MVAMLKIKVNKMSRGLIEAVSLLRHVLNVAVYSSGGSQLSVWCCLFSRLATLGGMFCASSCNCGFEWLLIVMCNLV